MNNTYESTITDYATSRNILTHDGKLKCDFFEFVNQDRTLQQEERASLIHAFWMLGQFHPLRVGELGRAYVNIK